MRIGLAVVMVAAGVLPAAGVLAGSAQDRLTVINRCSAVVWMTVLPNVDRPKLAGDEPVRLAPGESHRYAVPDAGWAGRMWPKTGCDAQGRNCTAGDNVPPCPAGGCQPPADTKFEVTFPPLTAGKGAATDGAATSGAASFGGPGGEAALTYYDISLVDGYSLPMRVDPSPAGGACIPLQCRVSLEACPRDEASGLGDLAVRQDGQDGKTVMCLAPCKKWNVPAPFGLGRSEKEGAGLMLCCPTPPVEPGACQSGPILQTAYLAEVRRTCPQAYGYAYDDAAGLHACPADVRFTVTLCPPE